MKLHKRGASLVKEKKKVKIFRSESNKVSLRQYPTPSRYLRGLTYNVRKISRVAWNPPGNHSGQRFQLATEKLLVLTLPTSSFVELHSTVPIPVREKNLNLNYSWIWKKEDYPPYFWKRRNQCWRMKWKLHKPGLEGVWDDYENCCFIKRQNTLGKWKTGD